MFSIFNKYTRANRCSALLFLSRDALEVKDGSYKYEDSCRAILSLRSVIRITLDGVKSGAYTTQTAVELVPIWGLHCLFLAATSHIEFGDKSNEEEWSRDLECLQQTLSWFKAKWMIAGSYILGRPMYNPLMLNLRLLLGLLKDDHSYHQRH